MKDTEKQVLDLDNPEYYYNRELSWLKFNLRVLKEAMVEETPLLERLKFIAIASSNLDEFFMVRVASLWDAVEQGSKKRDAAGMTAQEQLDAIAKAAHEQVKTQYKYVQSLRKEMEKVGLVFTTVDNLSEEGQQEMETYFREIVYPTLTPMAVDASHPFPFLGNKTLNLAVDLVKQDGEQSTGIVQVPSVLDRIKEVETEGQRTFLFLEDIIATYVDKLFTGCKIVDTVPFRVTRNSDLALEEATTDDLLKAMKQSLRKRTRGAAVRLEMSKTNNARINNFLYKNLHVTESEVYEVNDALDLTCFFKFTGLPNMWPWLYEPFVPQRPQELPTGADIFATLREHDVLLHHPYETFDPVVNFVQTAAEDPQVLAIKQTLYRVSGNSPIVAALAKAAENGKQVTVLVELKARFDEENNIRWASRLEQAGCHVIFGMVGLKTHAKIILVVRKEPNGIKRYCHFGTGNYNDSTAKLYTDLGLMTANDLFGSDASAFFNLLSSGCSVPPVWNKLAMAPLGLREKIYSLIDNEIALAKAGKGGHFIAKMNSLIDQPVIHKLYEASSAGVKIDLIVRGICGVRVGIPGISDNITVRSIVGRQLEHSRIFWFANGGEEQLFCSSADWMPRNLNERVELFFPVETDIHVQRIKNLLNLYLKDNVGAHIMQANGNYRRAHLVGEPCSSQKQLYEMAILAATEEKIPMEERLKPIYSKDKNNEE